jgi:hypothetical protein
MGMSHPYRGVSHWSNVWRTAGESQTCSRPTGALASPIPSRIVSTPSLPSGMLVTTGHQAHVLLAYGLRVPGYTGLATGHHVP